MRSLAHRGPLRAAPLRRDRGAARARGAGTPLPGRFLAWTLLAVIVGASPGCRTTPLPSDPDDKALATLGASLAFERLPAQIAGYGRLRIALMAETKGEAVEAQLEWRMEPGEAVTFAPRARGRSDVLLFTDLDPDRYRLASWAIAGRYETPSGNPILISRRGVFDTSLDSVRLRAGELVDLGRLDLSIRPDWSFTFRMDSAGDSSRLTSVRSQRPKLTGGFVDRSSALVSPTVVESAVEAVSPTDVAPADAGLAAEGAPKAPQAEEPGIAILGVQLRAHGDLARFAFARGTLTVKVRRLDRLEPLRTISLTWRLGPRETDAISRPRTVELLGDPSDEGNRLIRVAERAGEYELTAIQLKGVGRFQGETGDAGVDRQVLVEPSLGGTIPFTVEAGDAVDLGALRIELLSRGRGSLVPLRVGGASRVATWQASEAGADDAGLRPLDSPIRPAPREEGSR